MYICIYILISDSLNICYSEFFLTLFYSYLKGGVTASEEEAKRGGRYSSSHWIILQMVTKAMAGSPRCSLSDHHQLPPRFIRELLAWKQSLHLNLGTLVWGANAPSSISTDVPYVMCQEFSNLFI